MRTRGNGGIRVLFGVAIGLAAVGWPAAQSAPPPAGPRLTVPDGFEIVRVAGPPLVDRPIVADFDDEGRLYVADSSGSNAKVEQQLAEKPHRIVRLTDENGDGVFDTPVVFADRLMLPEGAMWLDGSLYVAAPPSIWKLTDTDGDGIADQREEWFQGKTLTGCANDLHGPYLGPDGWIYWTKGAFAEQTYERPGQPALVTRAAHIFRRRPGDTIIESVLTGGMDNPVDVAFTTTGERLLTATFLEHPQLGKRDALIHAVYGGVYGKPHGVIDGHPQTGDLMPPVCHFGPAAPAGLTAYASRAFGDDDRDSFFAALFNMQKVTRHMLEPNGATFTSRDSDFVVSDSLDFHPTDVIEDADGSLLVIDTGAWYKLCCPTSQLAKPDVLGGIYRVRRRDAARVRDARGRRLEWQAATPQALVARLGDPRPAVQQRAIQTLARKDPAQAIPLLARVVGSSPSADERRQAIWALTRLAPVEARAAVRAALADKDERVRLTALYAIGLWRDRDAVPQLLDALAAGSPHVRRRAAEALGRIGDARAVPALLAAAAPPLDRIGDHAVTYALIEIGDVAATTRGLTAASMRTRRAALIALDQMRGGALQASTIVPLLESPDPLLSETAWWIAKRHPDWGDALATFFAGRLAKAPVKPEARDLLEQQLSQFGGTAAVQALLARTVTQPPTPDAGVIALRAMALARVKALPAAWIEPIGAAISGGTPAAARLAVAVLRASPPAKDGAGDLPARLLRVGRDATRPTDIRLEALAALDTGLAIVDAEVFALLRDSLVVTQPVPVRLAAAAVVERATFDRAQLQALTAILRTSGPLELPRLLAAFDHGSDESLGLEMLAALAEAKGRSNVRAEVLRPRLAKYPESVRARGEALLLTWRADAAREAKRLDELLAVARGGDHLRGQTLFNSPKAACAACHAIGYRGGKIGPDLTAIGQIRSERDLLEAILFPSASFARGYESVVVTTTSGEVHGGVLRSDRGDDVVLVLADGQEVRLPRDRIADMQPGTVSVMPAGFADQLSRQELADLLAFLKGTRWGA